MSLQHIADCMKAGLSQDAVKEDVKKFLSSCTTAASAMSTDYWIDSGISDLQAAMVIRAIVIQRIGDINETLKVALSRGYLLPDSPFPTVERINASRSVFQPISLDYDSQTRLYNAGVELSNIAKSYKDGVITFDRKPAAQLSSYEISVDGISQQSGDPLADILGYQPDGDFIKRKRAIDSLSKLDFSKRKPYLLFTLESKTGDVVVCWSRMRDASGYIISRRDVFNERNLPDTAKDNASLIDSTNSLLKEEHVFQALSFYDWTSPQDVFMFADSSVVRDTLYSYNISGLQKKAPSSPFIFDVPSNSLLFSPTVAEAVKAAIAEESAHFNKDPLTVSPYPAISKVIYGDPSYGWMIAGCNMLASIRRGDTVDAVRSNAYVGSTADHIFSEALAGRLFIPSDLTKVQDAVEASVSSYGVSQTILSVLDGTGMTNFISGKDDPNGIQATQASVEGSTSGLAKILSVIDPETATLDPKLIIIASKPRAFRTFSLQLRSESTAIDEIVGMGIIDLTTSSGIGQLMQLLRSVYDFYPGAFV